MNPIRTILAAVDFSTSSRAALQQAARLAKAHGAELRVLHVVNNRVVADIARARQMDFERQADLSLTGARLALQDWMAGAGVPSEVHPEVVVGVPVDTILAAAAEADLVVLGAKGSGGAQAGGGSVGPKVARKAHRSVLMVPAECSASFHKVMVAVDFSSHSSIVVREAERVCAPDEPAYQLLHVWHQPWATAPYLLPVSEAPVDMREAYLTSLEAEMAEFAQLQPVSAATTLHEDPNPAQGIRDVSAQAGAELLVVGTHGHSDLRVFLLGSTAESLLKLWDGALLVVGAAAD